MDLFAILVLFILLVIVVLFITRPFMRGWEAKAQASHDLSALLAERERALSALQELDFDYRLGKVPPEEFTSQRAELLRKGADILMKLDQVSDRQIVTPVETNQPSAQATDEHIEDLISKRRSERSQKPAGFCPNCGKPVMAADQFCPACGQLIADK